jgi:uncharacterized repeat protein (TIGR01451 family)
VVPELILQVARSVLNRRVRERLRVARIGRQRTTVALAAGAALALGYAAPAHAARFGVPTNLNAAGQVCTAVAPPAGCTAVSTDPPGWFVLERLDSGSANGDIVHQIRFFVEVTGTTLDIRVFDAGPSSARDLGRDVQIRYRLRNPNNNAIATATITTDNAVTQNRLARFACQDGNNTPAVFQALDAPFGATNRIFGTGAGTCAALARGLYIFEVRIQDSTGDPTYEGRNAFGVEFLDSAGTPYNAFTIGDADDDINTVAADDTSLITGAVAGDRPTANVSGYTAFFPYVNRGCTIEAINFDLDADNAEGNGSVATLVDTLGAASDLARSNNDDVATTTVSVEPTGATNLVANNYGMFTLRTRLSNSATPQNHLDWRVADFRGSTAGNPANLPRHPISPIRTYLPNDYSACTTSGCALTSPQEPVLAASAVLLSGENPPLPGGAATRFAMTATVSNPGTTAITAVQITVPLVAGATFVAGTQLGTIDGAAATCADGSAAGYRRCTFATLAAGSYASLGFEIDFQPAATGVQNLTGAPAAGSPPPNTTVWARYTPASQSTTFDRTETLGPICQLAVNAAPVSDLALLTPTDNPDPVTAGSNLTYTFQLRNLGPNAAPNASVTDVLPPGTTFVSATPPTGWSCVTPAVGLSGTVRCSASSFTLTTVTFTVVVRVDSTVANGTILTNSVSATSGNTDTNTSNNALSMTTTAAAAAANADLAVTKADIPDPVPAGQDLTYLIVVTNNGPATALAVTLTDAVPAGTTFRSISTPGGWSCTTPAVGGTGSVSCTLDSLSSGQLSAVTLRVRVDAGATAGSTITNTASVSSALADPVSGNNSASATTSVAAANTCPTPGKDGTGGTLSSVINTYHPGAATAAAGATSIVLGASRGAVATIAVGDLVLVMQMQDATINSSNTDAYGDGTAADGEARGATAQNNVGGYEYAVAASAIPAAGGTLTLSQGLLNTYTSTASVTSITRGGGTGTATTAYGHGLVVGDFVTIAGANQGSLNNTFTVLTTPTPTTFTFAVNGFTNGTGTITATKSETPTGQGQRRFQVVRVPQYTTATLGPTLTASYWDGSSGGVLAFDVQGTLALEGATVSVSGRGFRGGGAQQRMGQAGGSDTAYVSLSTTNYHGSKGEGTAGTPRYVYDPNAPVVGVPDVVDTGAEGYSNGSFARGAPGTAGGGGTDSDPAANDENSGGGGGGNGGLGGRGGNGWRSNASTGGFGGGEIAADPGLVTLGGGGGAGTRNNSAGDESSGNAGGGIVMIRADSLMGTGTIEANGLSANTTDTTPDNDAGGGGGAGGTVLVFAPNGGLDGLTVNARGGRGSDAWPTVRLTEYPGERHGPGGGGGGGRVFLSATPAAADVSGGAAGTTSVTPEVYGASDGSLGTVSTGLVVSQIPGIDTTGACSALAASVADLGIKVSGPADTIDACTAATYTFTVVNIGPDAALDATASFPIPATTTFQSLSPASGWTCTTPSVGGTGTVVCTLATFAAGASSGFSLTLRVGCSTPAGTLVAVTGSVGTASTDTNVPNDTTATANLVGPAIVLLSRASIRGVRVDRAGLVEFATGWQQRTAGFRLYQTDDRTGRRDLMPLASETIPAPRPDSQLPILYSARTAPITAPYLVIEEIERGGERRFMGPFPVGDAQQQTLLERIERRLARAGAEPAFVSSAAQARVVPLGPREAAVRSRLVPVRPRTIERRRPLDPASVKIETVGEGVATVARESLGAAGLPVGLRLAECRLTSQGRPVPFEVRDEGGAAEALVFRAEALDTLYSSRNVYVLSWGRWLPAMVVPLTREADPTRPGWLRVARPLLYVPSVPQGTDPWLWDQLVPGFGTWPYDWDPTVGTFDLAGWPDGAPTAVPVRLRFQGMTEHRHVVSVSLNGESLGTVEFDGVRSAYLEATASQLRSTANELRIDYATADGDPDGYAYLDYLELVRPDGWQDQAVVAVARPFDDSLPPAGAEYLIVTHPLFAAQAERLAEAKRAEGMQVAVADVENAYDRLSGGIQEANAVRALVRGASARGRLRYVLLLGDDSFDPDDRAGFGGRAFVPSLNGWDGIFGRVASENRYADVNGDGRPDVAIGRLPARTPAEADRLVDKVERQQALLAPGAGRHVFAVDNPGPDGFDFAGEAHAVAARLPSRVQTWVDLAEGITAARGRLFSALAEGAAITHYFGHGGPETWADEGLLTVEDAASLPSTGTVVLTWTCQVQFFQYLFGPSVNESLLLKPDGGAVAAFGPAGITDAPLQAALYERLYDELRRGRVALGEAIRRAKARAVAEDPRSVPVVEGWNLLGDPSLAIVAGPRGLPKRGR